MLGLFEQGALVESQNSPISVAHFVERIAEWNSMTADGIIVPLDNQTVQLSVGKNSSVVVVDGIDPVAGVRHRDSYRLWLGQALICKLVHFQEISK